MKKLIATTSVVLLLSGCGTIDGLLLDTGVDSAGNEIVEVSTTAKMATKGIGMIPVPFAGLLEAGALALLGGYAGFKRHKAGKMEKSTKAVAITLEKFFASPEGAEVANQIKSGISKKANQMGVEKELSNIVKSVS